MTLENQLQQILDIKNDDEDYKYSDFLQEYQCLFVKLQDNNAP